jgi:hypothetical protein
LLDEPFRLAEAAEHAMEALAVAHTLDPTLPEVWATYGVLARVADKDAAATKDSERKIALQLRARDYRQIEQFAPRFLATLARLGDTPSYGRAVILERLGRCLHLGGRPDLAIMGLRDAIAITKKTPPLSIGTPSFSNTFEPSAEGRQTSKLACRPR